MMAPHLTDISRVIQLTMAPGFMLAGIGAFLNVMTQRLARVAEASRDTGRAPQDAPGQADYAVARKLLTVRAKLINRAVALCTVSAILICALIGLMFIDALMEMNLAVVVGVFFVSAMATAITGLFVFLREVFLTTARLRRGEI